MVNFLGCISIYLPFPAVYYSEQKESFSGKWMVYISLGRKEIPRMRAVTSLKTGCPYARYREKVSDNFPYSLQKLPLQAIFTTRLPLYQNRGPSTIRSFLSWDSSDTFELFYLLTNFNQNSIRLFYLATSVNQLINVKLLSTLIFSKTRKQTNEKMLY